MRKNGTAAPAAAATSPPAEEAEASLGDSAAVVIPNTSPAPSQSDDVRMGGCVCVNSREAKKVVRCAMALERRRRRRALAGRRARR